MFSRISSLALILANLVPLAGVLFFDWMVLDILLLYWAESVIIGIVNVMRMATCRTQNLLSGMQLPDGKRAIAQKLAPELPAGFGNALRSFLIPFFVLHYGAFCAAHLSVVLSIFSTGGMRGGTASSLSDIMQPAFWVAVGSIAASHLYSYCSNFIGRGEYRNTGLIALMQRPYGRIVTMHVAIVFGAGLVTWLSTPLPMLLILVVAKIVIDLRLHEAERNKLADSSWQETTVRDPAGIRPR